jgi:hypothetical protein
MDACTNRYAAVVSRTMCDYISALQGSRLHDDWFLREDFIVYLTRILPFVLLVAFIVRRGENDKFSDVVFFRRIDMHKQLDGAL